MFLEHQNEERHKVLESEVIGVVTASLVLLVILVITTSLYCLQKKKRTTPPAMTWEVNDLYISQSSDDGSHTEPILPDWLKERKEMLFHSSCITKSEILGSGQYGFVYKGRLVQGKAVYVR